MLRALMQKKSHFSLLKKMLWVAPFICFIAGYTFLWLCASSNHHTAPAVIGKPIQEALQLLSAQGINTRIIKEKIDTDLPAGTIISQSPGPHQHIKTNQAIMLVLSKKPEYPIAPDFTHKKIEEIQKWLDQHHCSAKVYEVPHTYPAGTCIGQSPNPGALLKESSIIIYRSSGSKKLVIMPSLIGMRVPDAQELIKESGCTLEPHHSNKISPNHSCTTCIIREQKPFAGSIITVQAPLTIAVRCE